MKKEIKLRKLEKKRKNKIKMKNWEGRKLWRSHKEEKPDFGNLEDCITLKCIVKCKMI